MEHILSVKHLSVYYPIHSDLPMARVQKKKVVDDVSFDIQEGEIIGLVGESGCGKSTLAKAILGIQKDIEGEIIHTSKNPQMVFQDTYSALNPSKTIGWLLQEPLKMQKMKDAHQRLELVEQMLETVGLSKTYEDKYPNELSGGQRQRIGIGMALLQQPKLLIADEPVSALDVTIQKQIVELLLQLRKEKNIAILFISHDLRVVYQVCDRILIMKNGKIVESDDKNEVYFNPKHDYTKLLLRSAGIGESDV